MGVAMHLDLAYAHTYPLVRSGGLFLMIAGLGMIAGAAVPHRRTTVLAVFLLVAALLTAMFAHALSAPFGIPTSLQVGCLVGAVLLGMGLIAMVVRRYRTKGIRTVMLAVLMVVGVHFLPMAVAFGPLLLLLAALVCLNSACGLLTPALSLNLLWFLDGAAKFGVGAAMWLTGI
jgi:hypothetical protein